jgi:spore germination cell wall hydrolase CwlJ-like protein
MKSAKLRKHLNRVIILIILIGVVAVSASLTIDSQQQLIEHRTDEVIHVIDEKLNEFVSADDSDRLHKINLFIALADFHSQISDYDIQHDRIDSELNVALNQIVDWFYNSYISIVNEIAEEVTEDINEVQQYLANLSADIDSIREYFSIEELDAADIDVFDERSYRAELYAQLYRMYEMFLDEEFIPHKLDANGERINELTEVLCLIEDESIIDSERVVGLNDMINSLVEEFTDTDQTAAFEAGNIIHRFEAELFLQRIWFEEYYLMLVDEISNMAAEDEYDEATVKNKIEELRLVMQFIEDDAAVSHDYLLLISEQIEQLIEVYENDLTAIEARIKQRDLAAAAANRRSSATASSSTGSRTGTNNNNTSGSRAGTNNNNSGSGSSGSTSARVNNNYPSITSNCREMLARLVRLEAPNEGADGKQAVAEVVLNRMVSSRWSHANTIEEVIFDDKWGVQFTVKDRIWTDRGSPSSSDYAAVDRALGGSNILGRSYVFFNTRPVTQNDVVWIGTHAFSR